MEMRNRITVVVVFCLLAFTGYAQTNTFPSSGNVGIGTASPGYQLELRDGSGLRVIAGNATIMMSDIAKTMLLRMDNSGNLQLINNLNTPIVHFSNNGPIGIGLTNPQALLEIRGNMRISSEDVRYVNFETSIGGTPYGASWANGPSGAREFKISGFSYNPAGGSYYKTLSRFDGYNQLLLEDGLGNVGIGTQNPDQKLTVNGTVHAREIIVDTAISAVDLRLKPDNGWADFVFSPQYRLLSLPNLERYIRANGRLPDVPSAEEVKENGVSLAEMNAKLLQKVEELTLYVIEQEKRITDMERRLQQ